MERRLFFTTEHAMICASLLALLWILLMPTGARAHKPLFSSANASEPNSATRIPDPSVSHVLYVELTEDAPRKWFVFENEKPQELPMQVGLPVAVGEDDFHPVVLLFGPGLPAASEQLPFPPPQGEGLGTLRLQDLTEPHHFYEPVTGTESQILVETQVSLPEPGTYYGVVFEPTARPGKAWVSIGQSEGFSWSDVLRLPGWIGQVRRFHEIAGWPRWAWLSVLGLLGVALGVVAWVRQKGA